MQATGLLKAHQEGQPGHPWLPSGPARRGWLLTYRLHAGRAEEDKRPCRVGAGQNRTEETRECLSSGNRQLHHSQAPRPATTSIA